MAGPAITLNRTAPPTRPAATVEDVQKEQRKKITASVVSVSIIAHIVLGLGAGVFIVAQYFDPPPAVFEVKKDIRLPAQERQHRMNMAEFDALTPKPSFNEKLASLRPTEFALPDLPQIPLDQMLPLDPSELISDQVSSLVGSAGMGGGGSGLGGDGGLGGGFSFMGIESTGRRIVLMFDVSGSVVNKADRTGMPMSRIREETIELIGKLPISARFNLVQFVRNYKPFSEELMPASDTNKESAIQWVQNQWSDSGTMASSGRGVKSSVPNGIEWILEDVFKMEPDEIFIVSDGSFWSTTADGQEKIDYRSLGQRVQEAAQRTNIRINFVGFEMRSDERRELDRIIRRTNGRLREL